MKRNVLFEAGKASEIDTPHKYLPVFWGILSMEKSTKLTCTSEVSQTKATTENLIITVGGK